MLGFQKVVFFLKWVLFLRDGAFLRLLNIQNTLLYRDKAG